VQGGLGHEFLGDFTSKAGLVQVLKTEKMVIFFRAAIWRSLAKPSLQQAQPPPVRAASSAQEQNFLRLIGNERCASRVRARLRSVLPSLSAGCTQCSSAKLLTVPVF
jgi:hypothetical protein